MNIREKVRGALRRIAGVSLGDAIAAGAAGSSAFNDKRRTVFAVDSEYVRIFEDWNCGTEYPAEAHAAELAPVCGDARGAQGDQHDQRSDCGHEVASAGAARAVARRVAGCGGASPGADRYSGSAES